MAKLPPIMWAQRADKLYLTIDLQDVADPKIELTNGDAGGKMSFSGMGHSHAAGPEDHEYAIEVRRCDAPAPRQPPPPPLPIPPALLSGIPPIGDILAIWPYSYSRGRCNNAITMHSLVHAPRW